MLDSCHFIRCYIANSIQCRKEPYPDGSSGGGTTVGQLEILNLTHQIYYYIFGLSCYSILIV